MIHGYFICVKDIQDLKAIAAELPDAPGVYLMKDETGDIIYVGKAVSLRKRVYSYFGPHKDTKTRFLVARIHDIEFIPARNENEALVLENNLIKKWKPRYNINLKDGKTYPVIRITNEEFPGVFRTRRVLQDGSRYFGPFPGTGVLDDYLELINRMFPLRKCRGKLKKRKNPCLYYHIGRCSAPCAGVISREDYAVQVNKVRDLLSGKTKGLIRELEQEMKTLSAGLDFEKAALVRDNIKAVKIIGKEQDVQDFIEESRDYIAFAEIDELISFSVLQMRSGKLVGRELYSTASAGKAEDALVQFLMQYYTSERHPPGIVFAQISLDIATLRICFTDRSLSLPELRVPERGRHASILRMSGENARLDVERRKKRADNVYSIVQLQKALGLSVLPRRIEGFDIAQLAGKHTVAAMVSFYNGVPDRKNYRHFNIRTLNGKIDDFEAMREVIARRYTRVINDSLEVPDLVLIDGGKGQVSAAKEILDALGLSGIPVVGLAKKEEELFLPDKADPVVLDHTHDGLRVLVWVRDEAHRFGTSFNRQHRKNDISFSLLEEIPGIGPGRSSRLLEGFGSLEGIAGASVEEICTRASIPPDTAALVAEKAASYKAGKGRKGSKGP